MSVRRGIQRVVPVAVWGIAGVLACGEPPSRDMPALGPASEVTEFFPAGTWRTASDSERAPRYAEVLTTMTEPPLGADSLLDEETVRLTWVRTYHRPMAIRLVFSKSSCRVVMTVLDGKGGAALGNIRKRDSSETSLDRCNEVVRVLDDAGFWSDTLPPSVPARDGADWLFEARGARGYRAVARWTPEVKRDYRFAAAGRAFLRLAAFDEAADDPIY